MINFMRRSKLKKLLANYFHILNQLQTTIFSCYIHRDYFENRYRYEEKFQQMRCKLFRVMKRLRWRAVDLSQLENLYEIIFSLNILKSRILDHATFEVCEKEMRLLSHCITQALQAIESGADKITIDKSLVEITAAMDSLEEVYRSILQIVSPEPIVFLFFLQSLFALVDTLRVLTQESFHA